jgi:AsmA protein
MDIDKVLSKLEGSQEFNLVDLGAFFVAGPLGAAATGGYRLGEVYAQTGSGEGRIRKLVSDWKIKDGVAGATDCAFATKSHRVALKGRLNLAGERYDDVIVALIDDKGCAKFSQHISGPFGSPRIGAVSTAQSLLAPILNLFGKAKGMASGGRCEVFYNGSVRP